MPRSLSAHKRRIHLNFIKAIERMMRQDSPLAPSGWLQTPCAVSIKGTGHVVSEYVHKSKHTFNSGLQNYSISAGLSNLSIQ